MFPMGSYLCLYKSRAIINKICKNENLDSYGHKQLYTNENCKILLKIISKDTNKIKTNIDYRLPKLYDEKANSGLVNALLWPDPTVLKADDVGEYPSHGLLYSLVDCGV